MIGTDRIEVSRIEKLIKEKGNKFLDRIYTQNEIDYCESKGMNKYLHYAGRFAAKEAIFKAVNSIYYGPSNKTLKFKDIEIDNYEKGDENSGAPYVSFWDKDGQIDFFIPESSHSVSISISHVKEYAIAIAMVCK